MLTNNPTSITSFPPEVAKEVISKVKGYSTLAKLSAQNPIPFNGTEHFIFNLEGNAQIVGEGEQKLAGKAIMTSVTIKPVKFIYQTRITNEFMRASEEKQIDYLYLFADGFAKKIAQAFDIAAIHGLEPRSMTKASFKDKNSFDGLITENIIPFEADNIEDSLETAVNTICSKEYEVTGIALSPAAGQALAKIKVNGVTQYPEFRFGQNPDSFYRILTDINKNLVTTSEEGEADHAIVGDFQNMFKWGYAENIPLELIEYGDPDGTGRDLKAHNEICLRTEVFIGWGIMDKEAFTRIKA